MAFGLSVRSSVAEVESVCRAHLIALQPHVLSEEERKRGMAADYAVDQHFELYAYEAINTTADALALANALDREEGLGGCAKAHGIRSYLRQPFWAEGGANGARRLRSAVSKNRRIVCAAHESVSYARRSR